MAHHTEQHNGQRLRDNSTGELVKQLSEQTSTLVRKEIELARAELTEKGRHAGKSAGMFGGAGMFGWFAFGALTVCLILALASAMPDWVAALIVAAVYGAIAAVLALQGKHKLDESMPPKPEQTVETLKEDVEWAKTQARSVKR